MSLCCCHWATAQEREGGQQLTKECRGASRTAPGEASPTPPRVKALSGHGARWRGTPQRGQPHRTTAHCALLAKPKATEAPEEHWLAPLTSQRPRWPKLSSEFKLGTVWPWEEGGKFKREAGREGEEAEAGHRCWLLQRGNKWPQD